jgi:hypothetical protein
MLHQLDLFVGERTNLLSVEKDSALNFILFKQRHA